MLVSLVPPPLRVAHHTVWALDQVRVVAVVAVVVMTAVWRETVWDRLASLSDGCELWARRGVGRERVCEWGERECVSGERECVSGARELSFMKQYCK